jgi:cytochrome c oxidase assembly protein subunit 15
MHAPSPDHVFSPDSSDPRYRWALHRFACFCAGSVLFLICIGGIVTSENAGMSVPDWPSSYGYNMFYFPWQQWVGGVFFEHSHRLVGSGVGTLTYILTIWLFFQERIWLRWLGVAAAIMVSIQGLLGGLRVIEMNSTIGIFHAALAQIFFVTMALIALFTSRWWIEFRGEFTAPQWTGRALAICGLIFLQLLLGATMRHEHAGLSIKDFPLAYGQVWPSTDAASVARYNAVRLTQYNALGQQEMPTSALYINIQMAHRVGAILITAAILAVAVAMWLVPGTAPMLRFWSAVWVGLVLLQIALGAFTIWTNKAADIATTHVAVGALTLVLGALLTAMSWRLQSQAELAKRGVA